MAGIIPKLAPSKKTNKDKSTYEKGGQAPVSLSPLLAEGDKLPNSGGKKSFKKPRIERQGNIDSIMAKVGKKKEHKNTVAGLKGLWCSTLPEVLDLETIQDTYLTDTQGYLLKHVMKVCKLYEIDPRVLIKDVLFNWQKYTNSISIKKDLHDVPVVPVVEWVTKHVDTLCQSHMEFNKEKEAHAKQSVQLIAKSKPKKPKFTKAQLLEMYGGMLHED